MATGPVQQRRGQRVRRVTLRPVYTIGYGAAPCVDVLVPQRTRLTGVVRTATDVDGAPLRPFVIVR